MLLYFRYLSLYLYLYLRWTIVFLSDGNQTCTRTWMCSLAPRSNCCSVPKVGIFAEEGPQNHPPDCIRYAIRFCVCICWGTIPFCSKTRIGEKIFCSIAKPNSCLHDLLPQRRDLDIISRLRRHTAYPIPRTRTNKYRSFIHFALAKYQ